MMHGFAGTGLKHRPNGPKVYVMILNWNGWTDTIECLESVFRQNYPNFRIVVCDNASTDGSLLHIRSWAEGKLHVGVLADHPLRPLSFPPASKPIPYVEYDRYQAEAGGASTEGHHPLVLIQTGANLGFAGGNNVGLRYVLARGDADYIWLVNNDAVVAPSALSAMVDLAERNSQVGMVGSRLLDYQRPEIVQAFGGGRLRAWQGRSILVGRNEKDTDQELEPVSIDYITGASLLVRAAAAGRVGLMDERYFLYSEEADWCLRMRHAGFRLVYCSGSRVWHKEGKSTVYRSPLHDYHSVRSSLLFVRKFFPYYLPFALLYWVYRSLLPKVVRMQPARLRAVLAAYRDFFLGRTSYAGDNS